MVRATRSSATHPEKGSEESEKATSSSPPNNKTKMATKKRKRNSGMDMDEVPTSKQPRSEEGDEAIKDEEMQDADGLSSVGELPLKDDDAQKILDILEMVDTQGLLDRVFPLDNVVRNKGSSSPSSSKTLADSSSLRMLLKESGDHPLRVYRSAVKQLHPISSQPRSRPSPPAAQQLRFCQLALSMIDMASRHSLDTLSLNPDLICPTGTVDDYSDDTTILSARRKYALVQRLPNGEWWTSLNLDALEADNKSLTDLNTGHADLVAILPSPSTSSKTPPTLSSLEFKGKQASKMKPPGPRRISCGSFLDYGPYTSFAPTFESDGAEFGVVGVTNALWRQNEKQKMREKARILADRYRKKLATSTVASMEVDGVLESDPAEAADIIEDREKEKQKELLSSIFGEDSESVQKLLDTLTCEENITSLLGNNVKALLRLEELQRSRLCGEGGGSSTVEEGSEEWTIAQGIMESLTLLASLRPRLPNKETSAIIPPAAVLRSLHRTLPSQPTSGWYGSLSSSHGLALRDDTTILVKAPSAQPTPQPAPAISAQSSAASTQNASSLYTPANYSYANYTPQQQRTGYTPQTPGGYFPNTYNLNIGTPLAQKSQIPYTPQFNPSQYSYASWYPNQVTSTGASNTNTPGPTSRKGTPQPAAAPPAINSTYTPYSALAAATPVRAVGNTITNKTQPNGWMTPSMFTGTGMARTGSQSSLSTTQYTMPTPTLNGYQLANS